MKTIIFAGVLLSLAGCATNYATTSPSEVAKAIEVKNSDFDSDITYTGPQAMSETRRGLFVDYQTVRLAAVKNKKTGVTNYAVYVNVMYSFDWRFYRSASFRDGKQVEVKSLNQHVNSCSGAGCIHTEEVLFLVELDRLRTGGNLDFRLNAKTGAENLISIPRSYIDGFLNGLPAGV